MPCVGVVGCFFFTAFLLLRRGDGYGMVINGPRWREIVGSQWQLCKSEREKAEEQTSIGGWRHAMAAAAAKRRSVEAFMLLALLCLFFFWRGEEEGGNMLVRGHLFPLQQPRRVRYRWPPVGWNLESRWRRWESRGEWRDVDLFGLQFWSPRPPVSPLQEPSRPGAKGFPGGGTGP